MNCSRARATLWIATALVAGALPARAAEVIRIDDLDAGEDLRVEHFRVDRPVTLRLQCVGAGDGDAEEMYAYGWILDARTRDVVWSLDPRSGKRDKEQRITFDGDIALQPGIYAACYAAYGDWRMRWRIIKIMDKEIMRIEMPRKLSKKLERDAQSWKLLLETRTDRDLASVRPAPPPEPGSDPRLVVQMIGLRDNAFEKRGFTLPERSRLTVYGIGEWDQGNEAMADGCWILEAESRKRVWALGPDNFRHAGGAAKNKVARETITLPAGNYVAYACTDDSHGKDAWNAPPPYDPESWGITLWAESDDLARRVRPFDDDAEHPALLSIARQGSDAYASQGFTLAHPARLRVYSLGECTSASGCVDRGWIENYHTRDRVWEFEPEKTLPAGGATKNRYMDETIALAAGDYVAYYVTDDSHAFEDWNQTPPHDPEHWGVTLYGVDRLSASEFKLFDPERRAEADKPYLVRLVRIGDNEKRSERFRVDKPTRVHILAVGEGVEPDMVDYGWIENRTTGDVVWELTWRNSRWAGGAKKNRIFDGEMLLDRGEYEAYYETDGSHAWKAWNQAPPDDPGLWGLTITIVK